MLNVLLATVDTLQNWGFKLPLEGEDSTFGFQQSQLCSHQQNFLLKHTYIFKSSL